MGRMRPLRIAEVGRVGPGDIQRDLAAFATLVVVPLVVALAAPHACAAEMSADTDARYSPQAVEFFETKIRPILAERCYGCHHDDSCPARDEQVQLQ